MARPREFDMNAATARAMALFWSDGYDESSLSDLLQGMGIARGSLYKAYGDKRSVWMAALSLYDRTVVHDAVTMLSDSTAGTGLSRIAAFLDAPAASVRTGDDRRGCFLCNAAVDRGPNDVDGNRLVLSMFSRLEQGLRTALSDDAVSTHWDANTVAARAHTTLTVYTGLRVLVRAGGPLASIEKTATDFIDSLRT